MNATRFVCYIFLMLIPLSLHFAQVKNKLIAFGHLENLTLLVVSESDNFQSFPKTEVILFVVLNSAKLDKLLKKRVLLKFIS